MKIAIFVSVFFLGVAAGSMWTVYLGLQPDGYVANSGKRLKLMEVSP